MSKKITNELLQEDLYKILEISIDANDKKIKQSFRKKALECHPDKNPDNPNAAEQFNRLKKILEILLDPGARRAYDKVLKSRKEASIRARELDTKSQQFKTDLENREKAARLHEETKLSEEERLKREVKRLEQEGERLIEEELEKLNRETEAFIFTKNGKVVPSQKQSPQNDNRIKAKWKKTNDWEGYTKEEIEKLFYKWGEINAVVLKTKGSKTTALIEFKDATGANLAVQFEKGLSGKPLEVTRCSKPEKDSSERTKESDTGSASRDFESVAEMNRRREEERRKLIEELLKEELL